MRCHIQIYIKRAIPRQHENNEPPKTPTDDLKTNNERLTYLIQFLENGKTKPSIGSTNDLQPSVTLQTQSRRPSFPALQTFISDPHWELRTCFAVRRRDGLGSRIE